MTNPAACVERIVPTAPVPPPARRSLFTGKERDTESGNDYFGARYYSSTMGRWLSPEYSMNSAIMELPQTWNKYSYEYNRPLYGTDPNGYCPPCVGALIGGVVEGGFDAGKQFIQGGYSFKNFSWSEFGGAVAGGAVTGAIAGAMGGTSLLANAAVGDLAAGTIGNLVGGVTQRGVTSALSGGKGSDEILSGAEISRDALTGFVGGGIGHLAGDFVHVPDDPVHNGTGITGRAVTDPAAFGKINRAVLRQMGISAIPSSLATHGTDSGIRGLGWDEFDFLDLLNRQDQPQRPSNSCTIYVTPNGNSGDC